jgi:hypothetical protein
MNLVLLHSKILYLYEYTNGAYVFCFLSSLPLFPLTTTAVFGSYQSSLYSELTLYRQCGLAYPYDWRDFVGDKKKTSIGLSVFNSSMEYS